MRSVDAQRPARLFSFGAAAFLTIAIASSAAQAATFSLSGGTSQNLPDNFAPGGWIQAANNNIGVGTSVSVFSNGGPAGGLSLSGPAELTFTFLGTEAGYSNVALIGGTQIFENHSAAYGAVSGPYLAGTGLIPFLFRSITAGNKDAINGGNVSENVLLGIKLISPTLAYLFFEDIAIGGDGDLDDMVLRVEIAGRGDAPLPNPLPGAVWLFGSAIAGASGIGAWRRRRRTQHA